MRRPARWFGIALLACPSAQADRPLAVEDASIAAARSCELETWVQRAPGQTEYWAAPACNVAGTWEIGAGLGRIDPDGAASGRSGVVQAKTLFRELEKNGWGIGISIAHQSYEGHDGIGDLSVVVPASWSLRDDRILVHANLGWMRGRASGDHGGMWAAGVEWATSPRLTLSFEAYGARFSHSFAQGGMRFTLIPERLALDAGVGTRLTRFGAEAYYTVGMTLASQAGR